MRRLGPVAVSILLVLVSQVANANAIQITSASTDKSSYATGDFATISLNLLANNESLESINVVAGCETLSACPLGGQVISGVVAAPGIPPQVILRGPSSLAQGATGAYTGEVQIATVPSGQYRIIVSVTVTPLHTQLISDNLTIQVTASPVTSGTGLSSLDLEAAGLALVVVIVAVFLAVRSRRRRLATEAEEDLSEWPSLPKQG